MSLKRERRRGENCNNKWRIAKIYNIVRTIATSQHRMSNGGHGKLLSGGYGEHLVNGSGKAQE